MWHQHHRSLQAACGASYRTFRPAGALSAKHTWVRIRTLQCPYYNLLVREMKVDGQLPLSGGNAGQERLESFQGCRLLLRIPLERRRQTFVSADVRGTGPS